MSKRIADLQNRADAGRTCARTRRAAEIEPRPLDPVWDGLLWAGKPTLLAGDPGLSKSILTCDIAARVTTGEPWPCSKEHRKPAEVLMVSAEDDAEDTIVPRLNAAGADLSRLTFLDGVTEHTEDGPRDTALVLDKHLEQVSDVLRSRKGAVRLLVVDPLSAYLGRNTDSHNEGDVRSVLAGLAGLAAKHRVAILAVRHLRKAEGASALQRVIGSVAFTAAARAVYVVVRDPNDDDRRLLLCTKNNLAPDTAGYSYQLDTLETGAPYLLWSEEREARTAEEVLTTATGKTNVTDTVEQWLRDLLLNGPLPSQELQRRAIEAGYKWRTVERARGRMPDVRTWRETLPGRGACGQWQWGLDASPPTPTQSDGGLGRDCSAPMSQPSRTHQTARPLCPVDVVCFRCDGEGCAWCRR